MDTRFLRRASAWFLAFFAVTGPVFAQPESRLIITGTIVEAGSGERVPNVLLQLESGKLARFSNTDGWFSFPVPDESGFLIVSHVGYETQRVALSAFKSGPLVITIKENTFSGQEVEVLAQRAGAVQNIQPSTISMNKVEMARIPAFFGQTDVLKTFQMLPGVQPGAEGTSGLYVRGGNTDQTLILLDGAPVYFAYHSSGFVSAFSAESIQSAELTSGGLPAKFGNRLGSVMQLTMKEGNAQRWTGSGTAGLIYGAVHAEGPVEKGTSTLLIDGRHSLFNGFMRAFEARGQGRGYILPLNDFYDYSVKYSRALDNNRKIVYSLFGSVDKIDYSRSSTTETVLNDKITSVKSKDVLKNRWANQLFSVRYVHAPDARSFYSITGFGSFFRTSFRQEDEDTYRQGNITTDRIGFLNQTTSGIADLGVKLDRTIHWSERISADWGASTVYHRFNTGRRNAVVLGLDESVSDEDEPPTNESNFLETDVYGDFFYRTRHFEIRSGLRGTVLNGVGKQRLFLQPRTVLNIGITDRFKLKTSLTHTIQTLHLLTNSGFGASTDLWVPVTQQTPAERSWAVSAGIAWQPGPKTEFTLDVYRRKMRRLIEYQEGAYFNGITRWNDQVTVGNGTSTGAEFFFRKHSGRFTAMFAYTYSLTDRSFDDLNRGRPFLFKYDRRHNIALTANIRRNKRWDFSANWVFMNGHRISLTNDLFDFWGDTPDTQGSFITLSHYSSRNNFQLGWYHRLDLSAHHVRMLGNKKTEWNFGFYNAYNNLNPAFAFAGALLPDGRKSINFYYLFPVVPFVSGKVHF